MGLFRNHGAPFTSEAGERIETGQTFEPSPLDLETRRYKLREVQGAPSPQPVADFAGFASSGAEQAASRAGLLVADFAGWLGSGREGRYTVADVRQILETR